MATATLGTLRLNAALYRIESGMRQLPDDARVLAYAYRQLETRIEELEEDAAPFASQIAQRKTYTVTEDHTSSLGDKP